MPNEGLEVIWHSLLSLIIPNLQQIVLTTGEHEATIMSQVSASHSAFVHCMKLSEVCTVKHSETIDSNFLIFGHDDQLAIVSCELETSHNLSNIDLVFEHD